MQPPIMMVSMLRMGKLVCLVISRSIQSHHDNLRVSFNINLKATLPFVVFKYFSLLFASVIERCPSKNINLNGA